MHDLFSLVRCSGAEAEAIFGSVFKDYYSVSDEEDVSGNSVKGRADSTVSLYRKFLDLAQLIALVD